MNYDELMAKKITEVRAYAASIGMGSNFGEKKADLVHRIVEVQSRMTTPRKDESAPLTDPKDERLRTKPPAKNVTQQELFQALLPYREIGLVVEFPEDDQYYFRFGLKEDSGNLRQNLRVILQRAEVLCQR